MVYFCSDVFSAWVFGRFLDVTGDGELKPTVAFVVSFFRSLSELSSPAAKRIVSLLPPNLVRIYYWEIR